VEDGRTPVINGGDYGTPDGTCVRDYIHVSDLAAAHVSAAQRIDRGEAIAAAYNLGSGEGTSVAEMMAAIAAAMDIDFTPVVGPRRAGDPARVVASGEKASADLSWKMSHTLTEMIESAWRARKSLSRE
jgi:UDP-glucose 4-epimerase